MRIFIGLILVLVFALLFAWVIQLFIDSTRLYYAELKKHNLIAGSYFEQSISIASTWGFNAYTLLAIIVLLMLIIFAAIALRKRGRAVR